MSILQGLRYSTFRTGVKKLGTRWTKCIALDVVYIEK